MEENIKSLKVEIIGKTFEFKYSSPRHEAQCRMAAEKVNEIAQQYKKQFFGQEESDILRIIAFQAAKESLQSKSDSESLDETMQDIASELHAYIEKESNSR